MEIMLSRMRIRRGMARLSEDPKVMMVLVITAMIIEMPGFVAQWWVTVKNSVVLFAVCNAGDSLLVAGGRLSAS